MYLPAEFLNVQDFLVKTLWDKTVSFEARGAPLLFFTGYDIEYFAFTSVFVCVRETERVYRLLCSLSGVDTTCLKHKIISNHQTVRCALNYTTGRLFAFNFNFHRNCFVVHYHHRAVHCKLVTIFYLNKK